MKNYPLKYKAIAALTGGYLWTVANTTLEIPTYKDLVLNEIKKAANYNSKKRKAGNGICITIKYVTTRTGAQRSATFSKWDGKTCKGATGYAGTFTTCKN